MIILKILKMAAEIISVKSDYASVQRELDILIMSTIYTITGALRHYGDSGIDLWNDTSKTTLLLQKLHKEEPEIVTELYYKVEDIRKQVEEIKQRERKTILAYV